MLQGQPGHLEHTSAYPSLFQQLTFRTKATLLQLQRGLRDRWVKPVPKHPQSTDPNQYPILATSKTPLRSSQDALEDRFIAGKIQNLRIALQHLNGIEIPQNGVFSFWRQIGPPIPQRGYAIGREIRQGCVIPSVGGGLCQLSNALYSLALDAGVEIIERHAHTQIVPGSLAEIGRDATVFWNYVDFRFKTHAPLRIEAVLTANDLIVNFRGPQQNSPPQSSPVQQTHRPVVDHTHQCDTCNVGDCLRSIRPDFHQQSWERTAYLVDEYWPEFDRYLQTHHRPNDFLALPLKGKQWHKANYAWTTEGFVQVQTATAMTIVRSLTSRRLATQGRDRQQQLLQSDRQLAQFFGQRLTYDMTHLVVMQPLLPFLWQQGYLGGRTFDVLMTRLPLSILQTRLDQAQRKHPTSPTLGDFRADPALIAAEAQALRAARRLITPHTDLARQFPDKTTLLNWELPGLQPQPITGKTILFPASTLGRKGAYELRTAAQTLNLSLQVLGADLEGEHFWEGLDVVRSPLNAFADVGLVVLPAYVEHNPRILLRAIAQGIPVIASAACGLENVPGVLTIPTGDEQALIQSIQTVLERASIPQKREYVSP